MFVSLRDDWLQLDISRGTAKFVLVTKGDYMNLVGTWFDPLNFVADNLANYVIVDPDLLISTTSIADVLPCMRKVWNDK